MNLWKILIALLVSFATLVAPPVTAQPYPTKPIRLIIPFAAGNSADVRGRQLAEILEQALGQRVTVDNRGGALGVVGVDAARIAAPDGYTLLLATTGPIGILPSMHKKLPYDPLRDFVPIAGFAVGRQVLVVRSESELRSVADIVRRAKAAPGQMTYASTGAGSSLHVAGAMFAHSAAIDILHVPFKSSATALTDLLGARVDMMFENMSALMGQLRGGTIRLLAVSGTPRLVAFPDVPTFTELGIADMNLYSWAGLVAPRGMPNDIIQRLHQVIDAAHRSGKTRALFENSGSEPLHKNPEEFGAFIRAEIAGWAKAVKVSGATIE
jgi:tripartite-type tricarboxylate transporter receptor subunit TctC